jgi:hypothetical protein
MKEYSVSGPELALVALTRGLLGAGIGYLSASRLTDEQRRAIGGTLVLVGIATTIPLVWEVFNHAGTAPVAQGRTAHGNAG